MMQIKASPPHTPVHILRQGIRALLAASIALGMLTGTSSTQAKRPISNDTPASKTSPKKKNVNKVTYQRSTSEETAAERDRRMLRECRGLHNAGACRGYTSK